MRTVTTMKLWNNPDFDPRKGEDGLSTQVKAMLGMAPPKVEWNEQTLADATVTPLMKGITIEPVRLSQLVKVSFESPDSKLAAQVANDIAANYIDSDRDAKFKLAQNLNGWLEKRAAEHVVHRQELRLARLDQHRRGRLVDRRHRECHRRAQRGQRRRQPQDGPLALLDAAPVVQQRQLAFLGQSDLDRGKRGHRLRRNLALRSDLNLVHMMLRRLPGPLRRFWNMPPGNAPDHGQ